MQEEHRNTFTNNQILNDHHCEYVFLLRRINEEGKSVMEIKADFSPPLRAQPTSSSDTPSFSTLPSFNKDKKFFTPSFILQEDEAKFEEKANECLVNHERRIKQYLEEKDQLLVPKPSKTNRFCLICKETYDDYLTHISYPSHSRLLKASPFYNDVIQICMKVSPHHQFKLNKPISKNKNKKQSSKTTIAKKQKLEPKNTETLSTGLQSSQDVQLCVSIK